MNDDDVIFVGEEVRACRVCLATGARLFELRPGALGDMYVDFTGIPVLTTDGLPQHLCSMCAALLKNAAAFKNRCRDTHTFLQSSCKWLGQYGKSKITMHLLKELHKTKFKLPYISTNTLTINITGNCDQNEVKEETESYYLKDEDNIDTLNELINIFDEPMLDEEPIEFQIIKGEMFADTNVIETEPTLIKKAVSKPKRKQVRTARAPKDDKEKNIKEYLLRCIVQTDNHHKTLFYNHILDKYFYKTKAIETDDYDVISDAEQDTILNCVDASDKIVTFADKMVTDNTESDKNVFFNYVREKYVNKSVEITKKLDVTSLRVKKMKPNKRFRTKEELDKFAERYNFEIIKLTKNEQIQDLEERKLSRSYQKARFRCDDCFKGFSTEFAYKNHLASHDPGRGSHHCEVCKFRFPTAVKLSRHSTQHRTKFVCKLCKQCLRTSTTAREHYKSHEGVSYVCKHCGLTFSKYASRVNHIRIHHGETACDICYAGFQNVFGVTQHKSKAHHKTFQCDVCAVQFDNAIAIKWHLAQSPDGTCDPTVRACAKCGELCVSKDVFEEHVALHRHVVHKARTQGARKRYNNNKKCCTCHSVDNSKNGDTERNEYSVPTKEYSVPAKEYSVPASVCPCIYGDACVCPFGSLQGCSGRIERTVPTSQYDGPGIQKWIHKGCCRETIQVMCEMCANVFANEKMLKAHMLVHTGEKRFECAQCSKRFLRKGSLRLHIRVHTGARPFKCALCPKTFKCHRAKHRHQLVHTKERRYRCELCDKMFQTSTVVKLHIRTVHMNVPQPPRVRRRRK